MSLVVLQSSCGHFRVFFLGGVFFVLEEGREVVSDLQYSVKFRCHLSRSEKIGTNENPKEPSQKHTVDARGWGLISTLSFCKVNFVTCGLALLWLKMTPFRFAKIGCCS